MGRINDPLHFEHSFRVWNADDQDVFQSPVFIIWWHDTSIVATFSPTVLALLRFVGQFLVSKRDVVDRKDIWVVGNQYAAERSLGSCETKLPQKEQLGRANPNCGHLDRGNLNCGHLDRGNPNCRHLGRRNPNTFPHQIADTIPVRIVETQVFAVHTAPFERAGHRVQVVCT